MVINKSDFGCAGTAATDLLSNPFCVAYTINRAAATAQENTHLRAGGTMEVNNKFDASIPSGVKIP